MSKDKKPEVFLVVDDSAAIRQMVEVTLTSAGYEVVTAADGVEALEYASENSARAVITDVNMPNMDGLTLTRELRALEPYKFLPILVLTTETDASKKQMGREAGATGWIEKPFDPDKLLALINRVL